MIKLEKKTGHELYLMELDIIDNSRKRKYDDRSTKRRATHERSEWIGLKGLLNHIDTHTEELYIFYKKTDDKETAGKIQALRQLKQELIEVY